MVRGAAVAWVQSLTQNFCRLWKFKISLKVITEQVHFSNLWSHELKLDVSWVLPLETLGPQKACLFLLVIDLRNYSLTPIMIQHMLSLLSQSIHDRRIKMRVLIKRKREQIIQQRETWFPAGLVIYMIFSENDSQLNEREKTRSLNLNSAIGKLKMKCKYPFCRFHVYHIITALPYLE